MAYLRIVLLGKWNSGKSSAGNTILGGSGFKVHQLGQRSVQCEVRHGEVAGRRLTVVDSPGWYYSSLLTPEMEKLEIQNSVCLCPPGPHAALLTVPLHEEFTKAERVAVEEHMSLLPQSVWSHTMVLFTYGDHQGKRSTEQHIMAGGEDLIWLVDKCENRFHVFNNDKRDDTQVTQLLEKIDHMVAGNRGGHYEVDGDVAENLSERKRNIEEHVYTFMTKTQIQSSALKALFEGEHQSLSDVNLMLVGGDESVRRTAGNLILQNIEFKSAALVGPLVGEQSGRSTVGNPIQVNRPTYCKTKLTECVRQHSCVAGRKVSVVICPDWSTTPPSQKTKDILQQGLTLCPLGPHAVLVNVPVWSSFSEADRRSVEEHMELLGYNVWRHALVLFTQGWWLGERRVEEYIESEGEPLRWLLEKCGYRYHVLQFYNVDSSEVTELMEKIDDMVTRNSGLFGPLESREDRSVRDTGHETRLNRKSAFTAEEWNRREKEWKTKEEKREREWRRREEVLIDRMLKFVATEPEVPTLPAVRRTRSMLWSPPSMSGGTPSEARSSYPWSPNKIYDWLLERHPGTIASSSGYDTTSEVLSLADIEGMSLTDEDGGCQPPQNNKKKK